MLDDYIDQRLQGWARWKQGSGSGGLGYATVQLVARVDNDGARGPTIPVLECEARETDQAVQALVGELRRTVEVYYLEPCGLPGKAAMLCCGESTIRARVARAHRLISGDLAERERKRRAERERVQALQTAARPRGEF